MTATLNSTATSITISDPNLVNYINSLTLEWGYGCSTTVSPISVSSKISGITNNSFTLSLSDVYPTNTPSKFPDGVYYFNMVYIYNPSVGQTNTVTTNTCLINDYLLKCKVLSSDNETLLEKYQALFYSNDCDSCECTTACKIFNDLQLELDITNTQNDSDCGCN